MITFFSLDVTSVTFMYPKIPAQIEYIKAILCVKQGWRIIAEKVTTGKLNNARNSSDLLSQGIFPAETTTA